GIDSTSAGAAMIEEINKVRLEACENEYPDPRDDTGQKKLTINDYVPIKLGVNCTKAATIRAAEGAVYLSHTRPDGTSTFTCLYSFTNSPGAIAENLGWTSASGSQMGGWIDERDAYLGKNSGQTGHYAALINPDYRYMGVSAFNPANDSAPFNWGCTAGNYAQRDTELSPLPGSAGNITVIQKIAVPIANVTEKKIIGADVMQPGETASLTLSATVSFPNGVRANTTQSCPVMGGLAWKSDNPDVLTIDTAGNLRAVGSGQANITATLGKGSSSVSVTRTIRVLGASVFPESLIDPEPITVESYGQPILPKTVQCRLSDGSSVEADVTWEAYDEKNLQTSFKSKEFTVSGTAHGLSVTQKIHVNAATFVKSYCKPDPVTTTVGATPTYPSAYVVMSNGLTYIDLAVDWDEKSLECYKTEGTHTISGTTKYSFPTDNGSVRFPVSATLIVKSEGSGSSGTGNGEAGGSGSANPGNGGAGGSGTPAGISTDEDGTLTLPYIITNADEKTEFSYTDENGQILYFIIKKGKAIITGCKDKNIKTLTIPALIRDQSGAEYPVTQIRAKAFYKCKKLAKLTIGKNTEKVGARAFYGCKKLKRLTFKTKKLTKKKVGKDAFKGLHKKLKVSYPKGKKKAYQKFIKS
ncbi:MAG: Ig-like domain-containing protein, partial [Lachnospiraceae bacterium]|nr:Ig-like domain-containing protein [Lachnospiraceae bacterium]